MLRAYCFESKFASKTQWDMVFACDLADAVAQCDELHANDTEPHINVSTKVVALRPAIVRVDKRVLAVDAAVENGVIGFIPRPNGKRFIRRCITRRDEDGSLTCFVQDEPFRLTWGIPQCDTSRAITNCSRSTTLSNS